MNKKFLWLSILGILISFAGGFLLANALNRNEMRRLSAENTRLQKQQDPQQSNQKGLELSDEEIRDKLAEAEKNPNDFGFQKGLGLALYRYAVMKSDSKLLEEVRKLLKRAYDLNNDDYEVIVSLGNINYDLGQINKDEESNLKSRKFYEEAMAKNGRDSNVITDYALTYLLMKTPDRNKAIEEFERALKFNPKNEKALVYLTQALVESNNNEEAQKHLTKLKEINPKNQRISDLENMISKNKK